nr:hypothetical protein GTC16762_14130 [Pigmentibacter ruber]
MYSDDDNNIINNCNYSNYLNNYNDTRLSKYFISEEKFFEAMENHKTDLFTSNQIDNFNTITKVKCENKCNDLNLNKIYESMVALSVKKNLILNSYFSEINQKIIKKMQLVMNDKFDQSIDNWINLKDEDIAFPSLQRQNFYIVRELPEVASKNEKMRYIIGLPVKIDNITYTNPNPNSSLQFDYIIKNSYRGEGIGLINSAAKFEKEREYSFKGFIVPVRGFRRTFKDVKTLQYGISNLDVEELKAPAGSVGWRNQRSRCSIESNVTLYGKSIASRNIPIICGISGSTNLALTSLFAYNVDLNERDLLLYLLQTWSIFSGDSGHSLQEVISTAKLVSIYYNSLLKQSDIDYQDLINSFPLLTIKNLEKVTKKIRPLADTKLKVDKAKWDTIESYIFAFNPLSTSSPKERLVIAVDYKKEKKYADLTIKEKQERKDFEYFFNNYDSINFNNAEFGTYYDGFFKNIDELSFKISRIEAQNYFKNYFIRSCSQNK